MKILKSKNIKFEYNDLFQKLRKVESLILKKSIFINKKFKSLMQFTVTDHDFTTISLSQKIQKLFLIQEENTKDIILKYSLLLILFIIFYKIHSFWYF